VASTGSSGRLVQVLVHGSTLPGRHCCVVQGTLRALPGSARATSTASVGVAVGPNKIGQHFGVASIGFSPETRVCSARSCRVRSLAPVMLRNTVRDRFRYRSSPAGAEVGGGGAPRAVELGRSRDRELLSSTDPA